MAVLSIVNVAHAFPHVPIAKVSKQFTGFQCLMRNDVIELSDAAQCSPEIGLHERPKLSMQPPDLWFVGRLGVWHKCFETHTRSGV